MDKAFIRKGHGYSSPGSSGMTPCTAFDGFVIIAEPMGEFSAADRERRVFGRKDGQPGTGTDYSSHAIKLATDDRGRGLYILMHNGSGREVLRVPEFFDRGDLAAHIATLPERLQYALLYTIWSAASNARSEAQSETRGEWAQAYIDGRIRKRRRAGRIIVSVETPFEKDLRTGRARAGALALDMASGELRAA